MIPARSRQTSYSWGDPRRAIIASMTTPRKLLVDPVNECDYHLVSRCVRRSFLCGPDPLTGRDCSHRRALSRVWDTRRSGPTTRKPDRTRFWAISRKLHGLRPILGRPPARDHCPHDNAKKAAGGSGERV